MCFKYDIFQKLVNYDYYNNNKVCHMIFSIFLHDLYLMYIRLSPHQTVNQYDDNRDRI